MKSMAAPSNDISTTYARDGYYLARGVFSEDMLVGLESDFDRIVAQLEHAGEATNARWPGAAMDVLDGGSSKLIHTHNVQRYSERWMRALQHDRFLGIAMAILGPDVILHHTKLFQKPPRDGAPFPVHQDWWYFPTKHDTMIAATIFLTEADDRAGGFRLYPGSHKLGRMVDTSGLKPSEALKSYTFDAATPVDARRGDVLFFSYFTLHASSMNRSDHVRKTVLVQMHSGNDFVLDNVEVNHANEYLVLAGWNHHMSRKFAAK